MVFEWRDIEKPTQLYFTDKEALDFKNGLKSFGYEKEVEGDMRRMNMFPNELEENLGNGKWKVLKKH